MSMRRSTIRLAAAALVVTSALPGAAPVGGAVDAAPAAKRELRITGWVTKPTVVAFGERPLVAVGERGVSYYDRVPLVQEARRVSPDGGVGRWRRQSVDTLMGGGYTYAAFVLSVPGPGSWQVRLRTLPTKEYRASRTRPRTVTMQEPQCRGLATNAAGTLSQCRVTTESGDSVRRDYWLQWGGGQAPGDLDATGLAVYFHGDGGDPSWEKDASGNLDVTRDDLTGDVGWALDRGFVLVNPMSGRWGGVVSLYGGWQQARQVGRDVAGLGAWLDAGPDVVYWGHSGGSWFLSESYIPAGMNQAPGPAVLNCGAAVPYRPRSDEFYPPYGHAWTWLPARQDGIRDAVPIRFNVGTEDFLVTDVRRAYRTYREMDFTVDKREWKGQGHCEPDFVDKTVEWWEKHLPG